MLHLLHAAGARLAGHVMTFVVIHGQCRAGEQGTAYDQGRGPVGFSVFHYYLRLSDCRR
jgi:hypothetical protein